MKVVVDPYTRGKCNHVTYMAQFGCRRKDNHEAELPISSFQQLNDARKTHIAYFERNKAPFHEICIGHSFATFWSGSDIIALLSLFSHCDIIYSKRRNTRTSETHPKIGLVT